MRSNDGSPADDALARMSHLLEEGLVRYPAPDVLKARIRSALVQQDRARARLERSVNRWTLLASAGLVVAVASGAATYAATRGSASSRLVADEVLASHVRSLMPHHLIDVASNDQHNVKPWFNGRVDFSPPVPALGSLGFILVGGRLDYLAGHPVAAVVYTRSGHVINVYSWPDTQDDARAIMTTAQGYQVLRWRRAGVAYWAVSDLSAPELSQFVTLYEGRETR